MGVLEGPIHSVSTEATKSKKRTVRMSSTAPIRCLYSLAGLMDKDREDGSFELRSKLRDFFLRNLAFQNKMRCCKDLVLSSFSPRRRAPTLRSQSYDSTSISSYGELENRQEKEVNVYIADVNRVWKTQCASYWLPMLWTNWASSKGNRCSFHRSKVLLSFRSCPQLQLPSCQETWFEFY